MASSEGSDEPPVINFSIMTPFRHVRLMEVSDDILDIISAATKDSEKGPRLTFKSLPPPSDTTALSGNFSATKTKDSVLHLCSAEKVWAVRQVSTSNSVYVVESSLLSNNNNSDDSQVQHDDRTPGAKNDNLTATAQVTSFLELQPITSSPHEIRETLQRLIPTYHHPTEPLDLHSTPLQPPLSLQDVHRNLPYPSTLVHTVTAQTCLFQHPSAQPPQCYIPASSTLLHVWSKIIEGCAIESIYLDGAINPQRITNILDDEVDVAIAKVMLEENGMFDICDLIATTTASQSRTLKPVETAIWVAGLILKSKSESETRASTTTSIPTSSFLETWSSLLPTTFLKFCTTETLSSHLPVSISEDGATISWMDDELNGSGTIHGALKTNGQEDTVGRGIVSGKVMGAKTGGAMAGGTGGKRKWHEKFAAQREREKAKKEKGT